MQIRMMRMAIRAGLFYGLSVLLFSQQPSKQNMTIHGSPSEPIATGSCVSTTFGYIELNGKTADFTDAEFGHVISAALRQGYVLTIYPPTKRGVFVNQECHPSPPDKP